MSLLGEELAIFLNYISVSFFPLKMRYKCIFNEWKMCRESKAKPWTRRHADPCHHQLPTDAFKNGVLSKVQTEGFPSHCRESFEQFLPFSKENVDNRIFDLQKLMHMINLINVNNSSRLSRTHHRYLNT